MDFMIVGDIHGCYYTLHTILNQHWKRDSEHLIILGDLVNKGKHSMKVLQYLFFLQEEFHDKILILKGNNEVLFLDKYKTDFADKAMKKFEKHGLDQKQTLKWLDKLPHFWENEYFFVSHAGVSKKTDYPIEDYQDYDLLFNRKSLKNIGKLQFLGHIIVDEPTFDKKSNAWYLDTGAGYGNFLSAVKIKSDASIVEFISIKVDDRDISN